MVTKSEDYPSPSKVSVEQSDESQSDGEWASKEDVILNVERLIEELLLHETSKLVTEHSQLKKHTPTVSPSLAGV